MLLQASILTTPIRYDFPLTSAITLTMLWSWMSVVSSATMLTGASVRIESSELQSAGRTTEGHSLTLETCPVTKHLPACSALITRAHNADYPTC